MSVVNKMLRDLDNRDYAKTFNAKSANYVAPRSSKALWSVIACLSALCVVAASYSFYLVNQNPANIPAHPTQQLESAALQKGDQYAQQRTEPVRRQAPRSTGKQVVENTQVFLPKPGKEVILEYGSPVRSQVQEVKTNSRDTSTSEFNVSPSDGSKGQLSTLRAKAHMASQKKNDAEVVRLLKEILLIAPNEMKTRKQLAALLFSTNQLNEAQKILVQGIEYTPADSSLRLMQSRILYKLGDNQSAFMVLKEHPYDALANDELVSFRAALA